MTIHWHFEKSSPQTVRTGESLDQSAGSFGTVTKYNSGAETKIHLPSGSITSPVPLLKPLNLTQALIDGVCAVFGLLFLCALAGSVPLAIGLMLFAGF